MNHKFNRHMNYDFKDKSLISFNTKKEIHCLSLNQISFKSSLNSSAIMIAKDDEIILCYDIYVYNNSYSLLLFHTNQSIQYTWISTNIQSNDPLSSSNNTDNNSLIAPMVVITSSCITGLSCIRWIPQANCFIVFTKDSYYYSNTILNQNNALELKISKVVINSEIGQQSRLICKDNNICVDIYLIHHYSLDVILMLKNKDTGLYSIQYCELKPVDNSIEMRWGYSIADDVSNRPLAITTAYHCIHEIGNDGLVDKQNGIVDQIDLHPHIHDMTGLCMTRYQVVVPVVTHSTGSTTTITCQVSILVSCMNELFYQLDFYIDLSSNACEVQQIYKKYYSSIDRFLDFDSIDACNDGKDLELLLPCNEYLLPLPVYETHHNTMIPCAFIGVHSNFGVQVFAEVRDMLGYGSEEQNFLRCLARLPDLNHISNIKQLIALDSTSTHSNMCIADPTIPQNLIAYCGNDWTSVLYRVSTHALPIHKHQEFIIDTVSYDDMQIISSPIIIQQHGAITAFSTVLLMLTSTSANQSCLINIDKLLVDDTDSVSNTSSIPITNVKTKISEQLQCNVQHCNYIHDQVTVNIFDTSHGTIQITRTSICLIPYNELHLPQKITTSTSSSSSPSTNSITTLKDLIRKSSKEISLYDIDSSGQLTLKTLVSIDKALDGNSFILTIHQSVYIADSNWLILACGQMLFIIQIVSIGTSINSKHGSYFVLKAIYYTSSAISCLSSSSEIQSSHLCLAFWNLDYGLQIFEINKLKELDFKNRIAISPITAYYNNSCIRHICMLPNIFVNMEVSIAGLICCKTDGSLYIYELIEDKLKNTSTVVNLVRSWKISKGIRNISKHSTVMDTTKVCYIIIIESFDNQNYMIKYTTTTSDSIKAAMLVWDCNMIACNSSLHRSCFYPYKSLSDNDICNSNGDHQGVITVGWLEKQYKHTNSVLRLCIGDMLIQPNKYCHAEKKTLLPGVINNLQLVNNSSHSSTSYILLLSDQSMMHYSMRPANRLISGLGFPVILSGMIALYDSFTLDCVWKQTIEQGICGSHMLLTALSCLVYDDDTAVANNQDTNNVISITWIYGEMQSNNIKLLKGIGINTTILDMNPDAYANNIIKLKCINYFSLDITTNISETNNLLSTRIVNNSTTNINNNPTITLLSEIERQVEIEEQKQDMDAKKVQSTHSHIRILPYHNLIVICTSNNVLYILRYHSNSSLDDNTKSTLEIDYQMNTTHTGAVVDMQLCSYHNNYMNGCSQAMQQIRHSHFSLINTSDGTCGGEMFRVFVSIALCGIEIYTSVLSSVQEKNLHIEYTYFIDCSTAIWTNIQVHQENVIEDNIIEEINQSIQLLFIERVSNKLQSAKVYIPTDYQRIQGISIQCQLNNVQLPNEYMSAQDMAGDSCMISYTVTSNMLVWNKFGDFYNITT